MATMANSNKAIDFKAVKEERKCWPVKTIVTHVRPHFDEVLGIFMLKKWGNKIFPGVEDAEIEVWTEGGIIDEYKKVGKTSDNLLQEEQILLVGTCGGIFDEHGKEASTCAHLVADYLGISNKPEFQQILQFCKRVDHDGHGMPFDINSLMKVMFDFFGDKDDGLQRVFDWAMDAIEAFVYGQQQFFGCESEFNKNGKILAGLGLLKIAIVESDSSKMNSWVRWRYSADVVIQRKKSGHTVILTNPKLDGLHLADVARVLRRRELQKRGKGKKFFPWQLLEKSGMIEECPWWYLHKEGGQILNGSLTAPDVRATLLSLDEVAGAVIAASALSFDPCVNVKCRAFCEKYPLGLLACRKKRLTQNEKK